MPLGQTVETRGARSAKAFFEVTLPRKRMALPAEILSTQWQEDTETSDSTQKTGNEEKSDKEVKAGRQLRNWK